MDRSTARLASGAGVFASAVALTMSLASPAQASGDAGYGQPQLPVVSDPAEATAVNFAQSELSSTALDGLCLEFVSDAYAQAGVDLGSESSSTYSAIDYWNGYAGAKNVGADVSPPAGALVFWDATATNPYGHVAISVGNGEAISTEERDNIGVHVFNIAARDAAGYSEVGWVMPA